MLRHMGFFFLPIPYYLFCSTSLLRLSQRCFSPCAKHGGCIPLNPKTLRALVRKESYLLSSAHSLEWANGLQSRRSETVYLRSTLNGLRLLHLISYNLVIQQRLKVTDHKGIFAGSFQNRLYLHIASTTGVSLSLAYFTTTNGNFLRQTALSGGINYRSSNLYDRI